MLRFVKHNYGFKIVHPDDGTIGGITYYDTHIVVGGLLRDYEVKEIFESIDNLIDPSHKDKPFTLKYLQSFFYSRKSPPLAECIIHSLQTSNCLREKFKYAKESLTSIGTGKYQYHYN